MSSPKKFHKFAKISNFPILNKMQHATHPLLMLIICAKYTKNPSRTVDATERTRFSKWRPNNLEDIGQGQRSSHATPPLMLVIICTKYGKNPSWTVDATERTRDAGRKDGWTDPQNGVLWLLLSINLGAFFLCGYWVLCGCVCMSRPTKRCLVATFVHKFGCLFSCVAIGFVWLQINKTATKVPTVPKNSLRSGVL